VCSVTVSYLKTGVFVPFRPVPWPLLPTSVSANCRQLPRHRRSAVLPFPHRHHEPHDGPGHREGGRNLRPPRMRDAAPYVQFSPIIPAYISTSRRGPPSEGPRPLFRASRRRPQAITCSCTPRSP